MIRRKYWRSAGTALAAFAIAGLAGCGQGQPQQKSAPPPPGVTVATPSQRTITDFDEYVGRFVAVDSVEVRARVSGYLDSIHFKDGQMVKEGDLLFTIDKRPFQTALDQAKATLEKARAELAFAQGDLDRAAQLVKDKTITVQTFDQRTQVKRVAEANVAAQEAAVRQAELDLQFTDLRAPVSGRIDAFQWKVPVEQKGTQDEELALAKLEELMALGEAKNEKVIEAKRVADDDVPQTVEVRTVPVTEAKPVAKPTSVPSA